MKLRSSLQIAKTLSFPAFARNTKSLHGDLKEIVEKSILKTAQRLLPKFGPKIIQFRPFH